MPGAGNQRQCFSTGRTRYGAAGSRKRRRPICSPRRGRDGTDAPWPSPSEVVAGCVDLGVALVVFELDCPIGNGEHEGAEGAVVVFPAVMDVEIFPGEGFDSCFEVLPDERMVRVF